MGSVPGFNKFSAASRSTMTLRAAMTSSRLKKPRTKRYPSSCIRARNCFPSPTIYELSRNSPNASSETSKHRPLEISDKSWAKFMSYTYNSSRFSKMDAVV